MQKYPFFLLLLYILASFGVCQAQSSFISPSVSAPCLQGVNLLTGEAEEESSALHVSYEYYQAGLNHVGQESLVLEADDFRIGKIKAIHPFQDASQDNYLFYEPGVTKVCEGNIKTIVYRYTDAHLLYAVEYYQLNSKGSWQLTQRERLFWQEDSVSARLISRALENENGEVTMCYCFSYNDKGKLVEERLVGNLSGQSPTPCKIGEDGYPQMNGQDSLGVRYVYAEEDPDLLIAQIEDGGIKTLYQYNSSKQCTALFREVQGELISRCFYFYDSQGLLQKAVADEGKGKSADDLTGVAHQQIIRFEIGRQAPLIGKPIKIESALLDVSSSQEVITYEINFYYDERGELISAVDSQGAMVMKTETPLDWLPQNQKNHCNQLTEMISLSQIWDRIVNSFFSCFQYLQFSAHQTKMKWNAELKLPEPIALALEKFGKALFGAPTYLLMGPHFEETHVDSYGLHEMSDKVRITFINGILNTRSMMHESLDSISESHGGVKIHYVFRPTEGWTWDISRAVVIKTAFTLGFRSFHAHLLAKLWKALIAEMGGVEGGGIIVHYAHSLGGSETDRARELLTPEEQKMIRVTTFGSSTLVRNFGFQSVLNIVSVNDGVSSGFLEPLGHLRNYFDPNSNVRFYGSRSKPPYWPTDHLLSGPTYGPVMQEMGKKFLKEFAPNDEE